MTSEATTQFYPPIKGVEARAIELTKQVKRELDAQGIYSRLDDHAIGLLGLHLARVEEVQDAELTLTQRLSHEQKLTAVIVRLRVHLGMAKSAQSERESKARGRGRPSNSDTWGDIDL